MAGRKKPVHELLWLAGEDGANGREVFVKARRWVWGAFFPFLMVMAGASLQEKQEFPNDAEIRQILADRVALGHNPGIVVGLVDAGGSRVVAVGTSDREGVPLDGSTVFEIGSLTKVFTATLLQAMVQAGEVHPDDPVSRYLPSQVAVPGSPGREITLLDLSTHRSGLPRMPLNFFPADVTNPYADYTVESMYAFLSSYTLPRAVGSEWEYSNLGMGLLGHALARAAGETYERLLRERVLEPLGMDQTGFDLAPPVNAPFAQGHGPDGQPVPSWDIPTLAGAGALRSTTADLLVFAEANLGPAPAPVHEALDATHRIRIPDIAPGLSMAMGWLVNQRFPERPIVWHNGGTGGFHSFLGLDESGHRAVVVLTNGTESIDDIGFHLLDPRNPLSPPDPGGSARSGTGRMDP